MTYISTVSVSKAGDVMMTSSSQKGKLLKKNSMTPNKDPPEGRTTAIVDLMRDRPKHSHHRQRSNKHYKQKLVRVLSDFGSDGDLIFVDKDKCCFPPQKGWFHSRGILQMGGFRPIKRLKLSWVSLNIPIAKGTFRHLILLSMTTLISHSMTLFLVSKPWKSMVWSWTLKIKW